MAVLKFVRENTTIPVPKLYFADTRTDNPVGIRYMLQERVRFFLCIYLYLIRVKIVGDRLGSHWPRMTEDQKERVVVKIAEYEAQLMGIHFPLIGSPIEDSSTGEFIVGYLGVFGQYILRDNIGPWGSSHDFIKAHIDAQLDLLENDEDSWRKERSLYRLHHKDDESQPPPLEYMKSWFKLFSGAIHRLDRKNVV